MNGIAKAGGILAIIAASFGIFTSVLMVLVGGLFDSTGAGSLGIIFIILGAVIMVVSVMMIIWSSAYIKDGSRKVLLGSMAAVCAVLSLFLGSWLSLILYIIASVLVFLGKERDEV